MLLLAVVCWCAACQPTTSKAWRPLARKALQEEGLLDAVDAEIASWTAPAGAVDSATTTTEEAEAA